MKTIYIAEDLPMQVALLRAAFEEEKKYRVEFFSDGLELYLAVQQRPPDMLLLDIIMPSLSGLAITRLLKFNEKFSRIPILVMSSITETDIREKATKTGADFFLPKPFETRELLSQVERLLP
jgi:two-component system alkaline phosphatase synthesis response regulator PhoP